MGNSPSVTLSVPKLAFPTGFVWERQPPAIKLRGPPVRTDGDPASGTPIANCEEESATTTPAMSLATITTATGKTSKSCLI